VIETNLPTLAASCGGYRIIPIRWLAPRLERERSRDGSCTNLSAIERNRKKLDDASKVYVNHVDRTIVCAPHVYKSVRVALETLEKAGGA
jgi:hypothetical protein